MSIPRYEDRVDVTRMRKERVEKARNQMKEDGIGAYLCFLQENIKYITDTYTHMMAPIITKFAIFPRNGDPMLFEDGLHYEKVKEESPWLKGNVFPGYNLRFYLTEGIRPQEFFTDLKKILGEHDLLNEPLGLDVPISTIAFPDMLKEEGLKVVDGNTSILKARIIKTHDEIECWKHSHTICEEIFNAIREAIRPGIRELDIQAIASRITHERDCDGTVEAVVCSGPNGVPNGLAWTNRRMKMGDMVFVDLPGVAWRGYRSCVYRCFICGRASQKQKEIYAEARELLYSAARLLVPGNTTADVCDGWPGPEHWGGKTWRDISECAIGHGQGVDTQEYPAITPLTAYDNPVTIQENMCLALETYFASYTPPVVGARVENGFVVTKEGSERVSLFPDYEPTECWV
ncbi:M24 family metallopeptidase [Chloroflexota bacterium]